MSYSDLYNSSLIYITAAFYLVGIQISIPSITTRKTYPNCIRSFDGYPLTGDADKSGLTYIACVIHKFDKPAKPWKSIKRISKKGIIKRVEQIINAYIVPKEDMQELFAKKLEYLSSDLSVIIPDKHKLSGWTTFLPPLSEVSIKKVSNITPEFEKNLQNEIRRGDKSQTEKINIMHGKTIYFTLELISSISNVVKNKAAILKNAAEEPFLENSCCNEKQSKTNDYFKREDSYITSINNKVEYISSLLYKIQKIAKAPFFLDTTDTKPKYPALPENYSEQTIYRAFISLCNYTNAVPIPSNLQPICINKPDNLKYDDTLNKQIQYLKQEGFNFTGSSLLQLLDIVNTQNIVRVSIMPKELNHIQILRDIISSKNYEWIPETFTNLISNLVDTYDISTHEEVEESRALKNYLAKENKTLLNNFIYFIKQNSKLSKRQINELTKKLSKLYDFQQIDDDIAYSKETSTTFKMHAFSKNAVTYIVNVFTNIIKNKVDYNNISIPQHWKLSQIHNLDIIKIIKKFYDPMSQYYGDPQLSLLCEVIQQKAKGIALLSETTPFLANTLKNNVLIHSIFDDKTIQLLSYYYLLSILNNITELSSNRSIIQVNTESVADEKPSEDLFDAEEKELEDISELEIIQGEKKGLSEKISSLLLLLLNQLFDSKKTIDYNKASIMERILRSKEKEKEQITDFLQDLSDEERNIETIFKKHKLERWGAGLQKGLTQYVQETYDQERMALEKQAIMDVKLGKNMFVTDMNRDIYALDVTMDERNVQEIENEINDLSFIPDDDDVAEEADNEGYLQST